MSYLPYLCLFAHSGVRYILTIYVTWPVSYKMQELLALCVRLDSSPVYGRVRVARLFSFLCCVLFVFGLVCPMLRVSLNCPFSIASSVFSNVYLNLNFGI